jgi:hypothetical protein
MHGRAGQGVSMVVDVVPTQDKGAGGAGESLGEISREVLQGSEVQLVKGFQALCGITSAPRRPRSPPPRAPLFAAHLSSSSPMGCPWLAANSSHVRFMDNAVSCLTVFPW